MPYLIDSDWVIDHLASVPEANRLLEQLAEEGIAISVVTYMEAYQGISRSPTPEQAEALFSRFVDGIPIIPFSIAVARRCAVLRETLRKQHRRVNPRALDLIIAATALEHDLTLVSRNLDDYSDIPNLKVYRPHS
jgi:tRNA(fMet)-specific endonuclease VapC